MISFKIIGMNTVDNNRLKRGDLICHPWSTPEKSIFGIITEIMYKEESGIGDDVCYIHWQTLEDLIDEVQQAKFLRKVET